MHAKFTNTFAYYPGFCQHAKYVDDRCWSGDYGLFKISRIWRSATAVLIWLRCRLQVCPWLTDQNPLLKLHLGLLQNHRGTELCNMAGILQRRWVCRRCVTSRSVSSARRSGELTASIKGPPKKRQYLPWQRWKSKSALSAICAY